MALSKVRFTRLDAGRTLFSVAVQSGVSMSRLSLIERQLVAPSREEQALIAAALAKTEDEIFEAAPPTAA